MGTPSSTERAMIGHVLDGHRLELRDHFTPSMWAEAVLREADRVAPIVKYLEGPQTLQDWLRSSSWEAPAEIAGESVLRLLEVRISRRPEDKRREHMFFLTRNGRIIHAGLVGGAYSCGVVDQARLAVILRSVTRKVAEITADNPGCYTTAPRYCGLAILEGLHGVMRRTEENRRRRLNELAGYRQATHNAVRRLNGWPIPE